MGELFDAFAQYLQLQADCFEDEVKRAAAESISPRGKFIRPILVFSAAGHADAGDKSLLRRAAIVELTHLSTLIHDDVIDGASVRRNTETPPCCSATQSSPTRWAWRSRKTTPTPQDARLFA